MGGGECSCHPAEQCEIHAAWAAADARVGSQGHGIGPPTGPSVGDDAPGRAPADPTLDHQSETEAAGTARTALQLEPLLSCVGNASVSDPRSDLPVDGKMPTVLGEGAGRSEPTLLDNGVFWLGRHARPITILHVTWLPWPVRLIHTRGAL